MGMIRRVVFWLRAVRCYAVSTSFTAVAFGGLYARWRGEEFSWVRFAVAAAAGMAMHAAANLWNDYFDYTGGVDREAGKCGSAMIFSGELTPHRVFRAACVCAAAAAAGGLWLAWQTGWMILGLGAAGLLGALGYCAGPHSPKHHAWGEVWVFLMMGMGMPLGGWMAQTGHGTWRVIVAALPVAVLTALLLYNNNLRDVEDDRAAGIRTLPMVLGARAARPAAWAMCAVAFLMIPAGIYAGLLPCQSIWTMAAAPFALVWGVRIGRGPVTHRDELWLAHIHLFFGGLLLAAMWVAQSGM